jgi:hypothetical protein
MTANENDRLPAAKTQRIGSRADEPERYGYVNGWNAYREAAIAALAAPEGDMPWRELPELESSAEFMRQCKLQWLRFIETHPGGQYQKARAQARKRAAHFANAEAAISDAAPEGAEDADAQKIAHRLYCELGKCCSDPMCFYGADKATQDLWTHSVAKVLGLATPTEGAAPEGFVTMDDLRARRTPEQQEAVEAARPAARAEIERLRQSVGLPAAPASGDGVRWRRRWKGSAPERGFSIVEDRLTHGNEIAYLGDQVSGDAVDAIIDAHNAALASPTGVDEATEWVVVCGTGYAPLPRFDNAAEALARYEAERKVPSYIRKDTFRSAQVLKITTRTEDVTPKTALAAQGGGAGHG